MESAALGALAVVGAQQGIVRGLSPLVSACFGVTITLGGVMRDVLCQRELRLGNLDGCQSYALASFCGGAVYVGLRELHVWNCAGSTHKLVAGGLPIGLRIALGASTAIAVRAFAWQRRPDGLLSGMDECADANERWLRVLFGGGASALGRVRMSTSPRVECNYSRMRKPCRVELIAAVFMSRVEMRLHYELYSHGYYALRRLKVLRWYCAFFFES